MLANADFRGWAYENFAPEPRGRHAGSFRDNSAAITVAITDRVVGAAQSSYAMISDVSAPCGT